jgi:hypothetical protein
MLEELIAGMDRWADVLQWTSSAPAVYLLNENDKPTFPWSSRLPLLVFGTVLAAYAGRYSTKETSDIQKNNVPVTEAACSIQTTSSQALKLDMVGMPDENGRQRGSLNEHSLVLSPITTTTPYSAADSIILASRISLEEVPRKTERAASPIVGNLALSKIILTVDIPPSSPGQWDDDAINRLSELLERW